MSDYVDETHVKITMLRLLYKPVSSVTKDGMMHCCGGKFKYCIAYNMYSTYVHCIHQFHESTTKYRLPSSLPMPNSKQDARMCSARSPSGFHQHPPGPADRSQTPDLAEIIANSLPLGGFSEEEARGRVNSSLLGAGDITHQPGWRFCGYFE